jgi:hypothetical protein
MAQRNEQTQRDEQATAFIGTRRYALLQALRENGTEADVIDLTLADDQPAEDPVHFWAFEDDYAVTLRGGPAPDSSKLASDLGWSVMAEVDRRGAQWTVYWIR